MCVFVCVYVCVFMCVCEIVCIHICVHVCVCSHVCVHVCVCIHCVCVCMHACVWGGCTAALTSRNRSPCRYFTSEVGDNEKGEQTTWWHLLLAEFFQHHDNLERRAEEWPHQLLCLGDHFHLSAALSQWSIFDRLYHEEYSSQLLSYWRKVSSLLPFTFLLRA